MFKPLLAAALALMAACATLETAPPELRPAREAIESFRLEGRIAVRHAGERFSAVFEWRHDVQSDEIVISGPLGQGLARLSRDGAAALLETADRQLYVATDLDGLSEQVFGTRLPVSGLGRWVLGRPAFGGAARLDEAGRPAGLAEQGWSIEYLRYESEAPDALPELLQAVRGEVEVRLIIDSWSQVGTSPPPAPCSAAGFAQPPGAEQCSAKPLPRPRQGGDGGSLRSGSETR